MIINCDFEENQILNAIEAVDKKDKLNPIKNFGDGKSSKLFVKTLLDSKIWKTNNQKQFHDINV